MIPQIIKTNETIAEVFPKNGRNFTLRELQEIVGGPIEILDLPYGRIMVVNEEGKYTKIDNTVASYIAGLFYPDYICGTVLYCDSNMVK